MRMLSFGRVTNDYITPFGRLSMLQRRGAREQAVRVRDAGKHCGRSSLTRVRASITDTYIDKVGTP